MSEIIFPRLKELVLRDCAFSSKFSAAGLAKALTSATGLKSLQFVSTALRGAAATSIFKKLVDSGIQLDSLGITLERKATKRTIPFVNVVSHVPILSFHCKGLREAPTDVSVDAFFLNVLRNGKLKELYITDCKIDTQMLGYLKSIILSKTCALRVLELRNCWIGEKKALEIIELVQNHATLVVFGLDRCNKLGSDAVVQACLRMVKANTKLVGLDIGLPQIEPNFVPYLMRNWHIENPALMSYLRGVIARFFDFVNVVDEDGRVVSTRIPVEVAWSVFIADTLPTQSGGERKEGLFDSIEGVRAVLRMAQTCKEHLGLVKVNQLVFDPPVDLRGKTSAIAWNEDMTAPAALQPQPLGRKRKGEGKSRGVKAKKPRKA